MQAISWIDRSTRLPSTNCHIAPTDSDPNELHQATQSRTHSGMLDTHMKHVSIMDKLAFRFVEVFIARIIARKSTDRQTASAQNSHPYLNLGMRPHTLLYPVPQLPVPNPAPHMMSTIESTSLNPTANAIRENLYSFF